GHRHARRGAGGDLHDPCAQLDARGARGNPAERREGVRAVRLRGPNRVVAEPLRLEGERRRVVGAEHPVSDHEAELHRRRSYCERASQVNEAASPSSCPSRSASPSRMPELPGCRDRSIMGVPLRTPRRRCGCRLTPRLLRQKAGRRYIEGMKAMNVPDAAKGGIGFVDLSGRRVVVPSAACLATLLLFGQGCRRPAPPSLGEEARESLGPVGVYSVGPPLDASLSGPIGVGKQGLEGAAKGGGIGLASGAGGGALTGAGLGLVCGPFAPMCVPGVAIWGAAIGAAGGLVVGSTTGAVNRGVNAIPTDAAEGARTAFSAALAGRELQAELRRRVLDVAGGQAAERIDLGSGSIPTTVSTPDYGRFAQRGARAVLEVGIARLALDGKGGRNPRLVLVIDARARLIRLPDNYVLWSAEHLTFESPRAKLLEWTADDSRLLR